MRVAGWGWGRRLHIFFEVMARYHHNGVKYFVCYMEKSGVGLHTGVLTKVRVLPAAVGEGRYFVRVDLPGPPVIPARVDAVVSTTLSTELGWEDARVRTVEHLLAALVGMGVDDARIEIDGPELPLLDGSAAEWIEAIPNGFPGRAVGTRDAWERRAVGTRAQVQITEPVWVQQGDAFVCAMPASKTRFTYGIDFSLPAIGKQWHSWEPVSEDFATEIAPARTFALADQIQQLRDRGLIKGGTLDNALVCGAEGWLNPPLRFANEPVRHKLLDLIGDMSLLGTIPVAHYLAYKASHHLHVQLVKKICQSSNSLDDISQSKMYLCPH